MFELVLMLLRACWSATLDDTGLFGGPRPPRPDEADVYGYPTPPR